jgi:exonuclease III
LDWVETTSSVIAAFQEVPPLPPGRRQHVWQLPDIVGSSPAKFQVLGCLGEGRVLLVASPDVRPLGPTFNDVYGRLLGLRVRVGTRDVLVVGIHSVDRLNNPTEFERGSWAARARLELERFWNGSESLILMGDFNAEPTDHELISLSGMHAVQDPGDLRGRSSLYHGRPVPPLLNPMFRVICSDPNVKGTYHLAAARAGALWRVVDHILLSPDLEPAIQGRAEIVTTIRPGTFAAQSRTKPGSLITGMGRPRSATYSDHLPVQLDVKL